MTSINSSSPNRSPSAGIPEHHGAFPAEPIQPDLLTWMTLYQSHHPNLTIALGQYPPMGIGGRNWNYKVAR
jgi:hypothetical protein